MRKYFRLLSFNLNSRLGLSAFSSGDKDSKDSKKLKSTIYIFVGLVLYMGFISCMMTASLYQAGAEYNLANIVLILMFSGGMLATLFFGIPSCMNTLYYSKDSELLAPFPIKQSVVFGVKFTEIYLYELIVSLVITLPVVVIHGIMSKCSVLYYLFALVVLLLIPVIPLLLASLLSTLLYAAFGKSRFREQLTSFLSIVFVAAILIGQQMIIPKIDSGSEMVSLVTLSDGIIASLTKFFPPLNWAVKPLMNLTPSTYNLAGAFLYFAIFLLASAAILVLTFLICSKLYVRFSTLFLESGKSRKKVNVSTAVKHTSAFGALFLNELRIILRTPVYFMNFFSGIIIGPIFACIPIFQGSYEVLKEQIKNLSGDNQYIVGAVVFAFLVFISSMNLAASTSVSREAHTVWFISTIPVPMKTQMNAKYAVTMAANLIITAIIAFLIFFVYEIPIIQLVLAFICVSLFSCIEAAFGIFVDLKRPKLDWTNEVEVSKQNINSMLAMFASWGFALGLGIIVVALYFIGMPPIAIAVSLITVCAVGAYLTYLLYTKAATSLKEIA